MPRSRYGPEDVAAMADLHLRGWSWAHIARRFGCHKDSVRRLVTRRRARTRTSCPLPFCVAGEPHDHCRSCGIVIDQGAGRLCGLCEREAQRALLVARGDMEAAERVRTREGDELLLSLLRARA